MHNLGGNRFELLCAWLWFTQFVFVCVIFQNSMHVYVLYRIA